MEANKENEHMRMSEVNENRAIDSELAVARQFTLGHLCFSDSEAGEAEGESFIVLCPVGLGELEAG